MMNTELLKQVRDKIASTPEAYDQTVYGRVEPRAPCGTAACIAGWTVVLGGAFTVEEIAKIGSLGGPHFYEIPNRAASLLGLDSDEADMLFTEDPKGDFSEWTDERDGGWPELFAEQWEDAFTPARRAAVAVAYLNHIIETGRVSGE